MTRHRISLCSTSATYQVQRACNCWIYRTHKMVSSLQFGLLLLQVQRRQHSFASYILAEWNSDVNVRNFWWLFAKVIINFLLTCCGCRGQAGFSATGASLPPDSICCSAFLKPLQYYSISHGAAYCGCETLFLTIKSEKCQKRKVCSLLGIISGLQASLQHTWLHEQIALNVLNGKVFQWKHNTWLTKRPLPCSWWVHSSLWWLPGRLSPGSGVAHSDGQRDLGSPATVCGSPLSGAFGHLHGLGHIPGLAQP